LIDQELEFNICLSESITGGYICHKRDNVEEQKISENLKLTSEKSVGVHNVQRDEGFGC